MDWPAMSPDLNPIEHAWDMLQKAISACHVKPTSVQELRHAHRGMGPDSSSYGPQAYQQHAEAMSGRN